MSSLGHIPIGRDWIANENFDEGDDSVIANDYSQKTVQGHHPLGPWLKDPDQNIH